MNASFEARAAQEISVGDYILSGGEPAAMVLLDACIRLLPGVMGAPDSATEESFADGLLEYPHYTRPADWAGRAVPDVLLSGNHAASPPLAPRPGRTDHQNPPARSLGRAHCRPACLLGSLGLEIWKGRQI